MVCFEHLAIECSIQIGINNLLFNFVYSNDALAKAVENVVGPLSPTDPDVLMLKAVSSASTHCLLQCLALIQRHHEISGDVRVRSHSEAAF